MKTLILYDNTGRIFLQISNTYLTPEGGINYLEIEIPTGKRVFKVDTSVTPNVPVYEDIPKSEIDILKETVDALVLASLEG
ncbi:hypothetical protein [Clostridium beijerinckii]|uniref:Uncharacterized protein n=1 Tax=Clostridium beijerinckii TaxID=1520 RepID=A0AAE5H7K1_CLOBE|nr:hypothetical protein [Clostridium beijerinckii]NSB16752.1 hypothetical protein [Clostridium beijerinckii]OOM19352.1 hypothetical protein CLOBE_53730 [Clostridium beijerinckii]